MDPATTTANASVRQDSSNRKISRSESSASDRKEKKEAAQPQQELADFGVTVKGRFDPDLRRFFVTILDSSSQTLIAQFPSQAAARYAQQLAKAAGDIEQSEPKDVGPKASQELRLDQTT